SPILHLLVLLRPTPTPTLLPYTTLFRFTATTRGSRARTAWRDTSATPRPAATASRIASVLPSSIAGRSATPSRARYRSATPRVRSEDLTSELQSLAYLVCRLLLEKKK